AEPTYSDIPALAVEGENPPLAGTDDEPTDPHLAAAADSAPKIVPIQRKPQPAPASAPAQVSTERTTPILQAPKAPAPSPAQAQPAAPAARPAIPAHLRMPELGPLGPLMEDPEVTEIMVNDLRN